MKFCRKCKQEKKESEFGKDSQKNDGLNPYCKECIKKRSAQQRKDNPEYVKHYAEKYREKNCLELRKKAKKRFLENKDEYLKRSQKSYLKHKDQIAQRRKEKRETPESRLKENARQKEWREKNKELYVKWIRKWQLANREKINAHAMVHRAVTRGKLERAKFCEKCGSNKGKMEGHHEDYSKPLEVKWLCRLCHAKLIMKL